MLELWLVCTMSVLEDGRRVCWHQVFGDWASAHEKHQNSDSDTKLVRVARGPDVRCPHCGNRVDFVRGSVRVEPPMPTKPAKRPSQLAAAEPKGIPTPVLCLLVLLAACCLAPAVCLVLSDWSEHGITS